VLYDKETPMPTGHLTGDVDTVIPAESLSTSGRTSSFTRTKGKRYFRETLGGRRVVQGAITEEAKVQTGITYWKGYWLVLGADQTVWFAGGGDHEGIVASFVEQKRKTPAPQA